MIARTYRFSPLDRTGVLLGLGGPQVLVVGAGVVAAVVLRSAGLSLALVVAPIAIAALAALLRVGGQPALEVAPPAGSFGLRALRRRNRWFAPVPALGADLSTSPALPPALDGQVVLGVDAEAAGFATPGTLAVVHDRRGGRVSATVAVSGGAFALVERAEQDRMVAAGGQAQAAFCTGASPVVAVRWSEWAAPADIDQPLGWLDAHGGDPDDAEVASYRAFVESAGRLAFRHEVLVSLIVDLGRVGRTREHGRLAAGVEVVCAELRSFAERLVAAGMSVSAPLSPAALSRALRLRLDPTASLLLDAQGQSLGQLAGLSTLANAGPLATDSSWSTWRVDESCHRGFLVTEWPRVDVAAAWMADLVLAGGVVRSLAVVAEPVPIRTSRRAIERQAAKRASDADHRERTGFRVGADHARAETAVAEREAELVAGFAELRFAGVVVVSAANPEALDGAARAMVQQADAVGIEIKALSGRHDQALGACVPLTRTLAPGAAS